MSATVIVTAITSFIGFALNSTVLAVVLWRGRRVYHYLFAGYLLICALWDVGIFLSMIRNDYVDELPTYGTIVWWPCTFMIAIIYTFTCTYLGQPRKWRTIGLWVVCAGVFVLGVLGLSGRIIGVWDYSWGHIYRPDQLLLTSTLFALPLMIYFGLSALWYLFKARRLETDPVRKRQRLSSPSIGSSRSTRRQSPRFARRRVDSTSRPPAMRSARPRRWRLPPTGRPGRRSRSASRGATSAACPRRG
jgi:hypothetical protein